MIPRYSLSATRPAPGDWVGGRRHRSQRRKLDSPRAPLAPILAGFGSEKALNPEDSPFLKLLDQRVVFFDGAMGTSLHAADLPLSDYRDLENCSEVLNLSRPDVIEQIHRTFLEVGCDVVETNTFGGTRIVLSEFDLQDQAYEINVAAARIARRACDAVQTPDRPRFVAGSMGPGTKLISLRQIDYDTMLRSYEEQARGLLDGGVDLLLIETCQDILQAKTVVQAVREAFDRVGRRVPLMVSVTMETTGTMLVGADVAGALVTLEAFPEIDVIGLNCATGPQEMSEHIRYLARTCPRKLSVMPNAGLPQIRDGQTHFPLTPDELARWLREFVEVDGVNIVGGCCGTTPAHLKAVIEAIGDRAPTPRNPEFEPASSSLYQAQPHRQENSFLIVGERCNTNGSKKFREMMLAGDTEGCVTLGIEQVREEGAHVLDVCVDYVGRDGAPDMHTLIDRMAREVTVPLMLDSTQIDVLEAGLKLAPGKCLINSVNLEDGEEKLARIAALARRYGAGLVALTIDEDPQEAMGKTAARKLEIATRLHDLLTKKHGIPEADIFFDCLTFPITTGAESDRRLGLETLDGIEAIMTRFPRCQSILGVSNISFGLLPPARVVLNSAFLDEARKRGLTAAIVHPGKIVPRNKVSDERWNAAQDLIYSRREQGDPLEHFIGLFDAGEKIGEREKIDDLPIEQRLERRIVDGARQGLEADLDEAMTKYPPLEIINTFLLNGMKVVGELFGSGQMQLPFVLKSAETMKAAVAHLEPSMDKVEGSTKGSIVLATVRGDVHDIGKNLVDIILSNNGFTVHNLGIKQPIANVIEAFHTHKADAIGLSGLLVKSTLVMRDDLGVLNENRMSPPVILGGAALTRSYVEDDLRTQYEGPLYYAKDAFDGLRLMREITDPAAREANRVPPRVPVKDKAAPAAVEDAERVGQVAARSADQLAEEAEQRFGLRDPSDETPAKQSAPAIAASSAATLARSSLPHEHAVPQPPFWGSRVLERIDLKAALAYVNETMLFQVQWGFRRKSRSPEEWQRYLGTEVRPIYRDLVRRCIEESILECRGVYGYWPCNSDGDDLILYEPPKDGAGANEHGPEMMRFTFPRQRKEPFRCLSDFWRPRNGADAPSADVVAFHIVTAGRRVSEVARDWFAKNDYQQYLFLHGLGVETAEALAEYIHKQVRIELGVADHDARELQRLFKQGYQGSRFSFGYPACPRLEDQTKIMELLRPERIDVELSEEYQLEPEQSTSAIITTHPNARYFNVR